MNDRMEQMVRLAQMIRDADLARQAALDQERATIAGKRKSLRDHARREDALAATDPAYSAAFEWPRRRWRGERMAELTRAEAEAAARAEAQRPQTARSFGRASVLEKIVQKLREQRKHRD